MPASYGQVRSHGARVNKKNSENDMMAAEKKAAERAYQGDMAKLKADEKKDKRRHTERMAGADMSETRKHLAEMADEKDERAYVSYKTSSRTTTRT